MVRSTKNCVLNVGGVGIRPKVEVGLMCEFDDL